MKLKSYAQNTPITAEGVRNNQTRQEKSHFDVGAKSNINLTQGSDYNASKGSVG